MADTNCTTTAKATPKGVMDREEFEQLADYHDAWYRMLETVNDAIGAVSDNQSLVARLSTLGAFIIDYARNDAEELQSRMIRQAEAQGVPHARA